MGLSSSNARSYLKLSKRSRDEFQLDEVEPIGPNGGSKIDADVYNSEAFIQNLGEALSRFRLSPPSTTRERK